MGIFDNKTDDSKKANKSKKGEGQEESMKDLYANDGRAKKSSAKKSFSQAYRILLRPVITEKATNLGAINQYIFEVDIKANKIEVAKAILEVYGVKPVNVNIVKIRGKKVSRGRITGKRKDFKKAIVTLKKGESISVYEGV